MTNAFGIESGSGAQIFPYTARALDPYANGFVFRFGTFIGWEESPIVADRLSRLPRGQLSSLDFIAIDHQSSGHNCRQDFVVARPSEIKTESLAFVTELCGKFYSAASGWFEEGLEPQTSHFMFQLKTAGLTLFDPKLSVMKGPRESVYPVQASSINIETLLKDHQTFMGELSPVLEDLVLRDCLAIYILAENSD